MTAVIVVLVATAVAMAVLLWMLRNPEVLTGAGDQPLNIRELDVGAFRRILDENDESYIRQYLRGKVFRRARRKRIRAAIDYTLRARLNAATILKVGEQRQKSADRALALEGQQLVQAAIALRHATFVALLRFRLALVFGSISLRGESLLHSCSELRRQVEAAKGVM